jgi:glycerophosphoryl diester phosphodiesterase
VPYLDHSRPIAFAHRGGAAHHPENSWRAFEYAARLGYAYLETDARSTSDGALVTPAAFAAVRYLGHPGKAMAARLARSGAQCAQVPMRIATRGFIRRAHELGLQVHVWTVNTRAGIERVLDLGVDGVMTDEVDLLRDILTERGQWHPAVRAAL